MDSWNDDQFDLILEESDHSDGTKKEAVQSTSLFSLCV